MLRKCGILECNLRFRSRLPGLRDLCLARRTSSRCCPSCIHAVSVYFPRMAVRLPRSSLLMEDNLLDMEKSHCEGRVDLWRFRPAHALGSDHARGGVARRKCCGKSRLSFQPNQFVCSPVEGAKGSQRTPPGGVGPVVMAGARTWELFLTWLHFSRGAASQTRSSTMLLG